MALGIGTAVFCYRGGKNEMIRIHNGKKSQCLISFFGGCEIAMDKIFIFRFYICFVYNILIILYYSVKWGGTYVHVISKNGLSDFN